MSKRLPLFDCILFSGYTSPFEWQLRHAAQRLRVPIVMRGEFAAARPDRSSLRLRAAGFIRRRFYRGISAFCSTGINSTKHLLEHGVPEHKVFLAPYCVDTAHFEELVHKTDRREARQALGLAEDALVVLFSGKFIERKRTDLLVRALEAVEERQQFGLIMLGSGPLWRQTTMRGDKLLGRRFIAPGFVNQGELGLYYAAADVFVLPSDYETWGLVVNEAMQFSLPVVVTHDVGCAADLVTQGETGFVFESGDGPRLTTILNQLNADRGRLRVMGNNARRRVLAYTPAAAAEGIRKAVHASVAAPSESP